MNQPYNSNYPNPNQGRPDQANPNQTNPNSGNFNQGSIPSSYSNPNNPTPNNPNLYPDQPTAYSQTNYHQPYPPTPQTGHSQQPITINDTADKNDKKLSLKKEKKSKDKNKSKPKRNIFFTIFRSLAVIFVLAIIIISLIVSYTLINPDQSFSKSVLNLSGLDSLVSNPSEGSDENQNTKIVNRVFGLDSDNNQRFAFQTREESKTIVQIVEENLPAVLSIDVTPANSDNFLSKDTGTGFIATLDGLVVTNKHVIAKACQNPSDYEIRALSGSQKVFELELMSVDPIYDIAILKIQTEDENPTFPIVKAADSSKTKLGTEVIAVGNALGQLQNSVTQGIVSGLDRSIQTFNSEALRDNCLNQDVGIIDGLIQTDAAINPGNSGGPLFDSTGLLIGMNTLGSQDAQNIGFAISSSTISSAVNSYLENDKIIRPRLGIFSSTINPLRKEEAPWLPVEYGELIESPSNQPAITRDSAADKSGLRDGDIIIAVNGEKLIPTTTDPSPLRRIILSQQAGDKVELEVYKAIETTETGWRYEEDSEIIELTLDGISFDLP